MCVPDAPVRVDEILRRPVIVMEGTPNDVLAIDRDRIVDSQRFGLAADVVEILLKSEFRGMDADNDQPLVLVLLAQARGRIACAAS